MGAETMRILYVGASWVPPPENPLQDRFVLLSERLEGDVLQPIWFDRAEQVEELFGPGTYPVYLRGRFRYHWFPVFQHSGWRRKISWLWFYIRTGYRIHREKPFDCIVVYSHMMPALAAVVLKLLTRAKLIVEIMTAPELAYKFELRRQTLAGTLSRMFSDFSLYVSALMSDRVHLLYKWQLGHYPLLQRVPSSVFHDFVLLSLIPPKAIPPPGEPEQVVLLVGAPWYLKGADLLIEAFGKIADEFPDVTVKIQGYYEDKDKLEALIAGSPRIEIVKAAPNPETLMRISRALILVHPSRCDGLSRVIIEAMGAGVPVIASDAGGNPNSVRDGDTGLVFPSGDAEELRKRLRLLLANRELRERLGKRGYEVAHAEYSEQVYVDQFTRMVEATVPVPRVQ
jgi:glycosyltransferase involved in cell wall biosynthesis